MREPLTPKQRVFGTLRNLLKIANTSRDLNKDRERLCIALDRCLSWESHLCDDFPNAQGHRKPPSRDRAHSSEPQPGGDASAPRC